MAAISNGDLKQSVCNDASQNSDLLSHGSEVNLVAETYESRHRNDDMKIHEQEHLPLMEMLGPAVLSPNELDGFLKVEKNQQCICKECGKVFNSVWYLKQHAVKHSNDRPFKCKFCHKTYKFRSNLYQHKCPDRVRPLNRRMKMVRVHQEQKQQQIWGNNGGMRLEKGLTGEETALARHRHHLPWDSPSSSSGSASTPNCAPSGLIFEHQQRMLVDGMAISVATEGARRRVPPESLDDYTFVPPMPNQQTVDAFLQRNRHKLHQCRKCKLMFPSREYLSRHTTWHSVRESRHGCLHCPQTFDSETDYARHKQLHVPHSTHVCRHCGGNFRSSLALRRHLDQSRTCGEDSDSGMSYDRPFNPFAFIDQRWKEKEEEDENKQNGHPVAVVADSGLGSSASSNSTNPSPVDSVEMTNSLTTLNSVQLNQSNSISLPVHSNGNIQTPSVTLSGSGKELSISRASGQMNGSLSLFTSAEPFQMSVSMNNYDDSPYIDSLFDRDQYLIAFEHNVDNLIGDVMQFMTSPVMSSRNILAAKVCQSRFETSEEEECVQLNKMLKSTDDFEGTAVCTETISSDWNAKSHLQYHCHSRPVEKLLLIDMETVIDYGSPLELSQLVSEDNGEVDDTSASKKDQSKNQKGDERTEQRSGLPCLSCDLLFKNRRQLSMHKITAHKDVRIRRHICSICQMGFKKQCHLREHSVTHNDCRTAQMLRRRRNMIAKWQRCPNCSYLFRSKNSRNEHWESCRKKTYSFRDIIVKYNEEEETVITEERLLTDGSALLDSQKKVKRLNGIMNGYAEKKDGSSSNFAIPQVNAAIIFPKTNSERKNEKNCRKSTARNETNKDKINDCEEDK